MDLYLPSLHDPRGLISFLESVAATPCLAKTDKALANVEMTMKAIVDSVTASEEKDTLWTHNHDTQRLITINAVSER